MSIEIGWSLTNWIVIHSDKGHRHFEHSFLASEAFPTLINESIGILLSMEPQLTQKYPPTSSDFKF